MKKFITLLAVVAGAAIFLPSTSEARDFHGHGHGHGHSHASSCGSCGHAIYRQRVVTGYDRHGCPVYGWRTASHRCPPRYGHGHGHHGHGHGHGSRSGGHISLPGFHLDFGGGRHRH